MTDAPDPLGVVLSLADLLALMTCIGILSCLLWVLSGRHSTDLAGHGLVFPLWRLLGICLAVLTVTGVGDLIHRSLAMSGEPATELLSILPAVWSQTHFGRVWLFRLMALGVLWLGWAVGSRLHSRWMAAIMLVAAAAIALTRSLSGHAVDWGSWALPQWVDWLHLLAASAWGGSLLALALAGFQAFAIRAARGTALAMIERLSSLAGAALAVVVATGIYNAWLELGSLAAFWETAYGKALSGKLGLAFCIVLLGAANRYVGIPRLRQWAGARGAGRGLSGRLARILALLTDWMSLGPSEPLAQFTRKLGVETILMAGLVACVALLVNLTPSRHLQHPDGAMHHHSRAPVMNPAGFPAAALHPGRRQGRSQAGPARKAPALAPATRISDRRRGRGLPSPRHPHRRCPP